MGYETEQNFSSTTGTKLLYAQQRYYDPAIGRFISPDPLGFADGLNPYRYVDNDPINHVDPSGQAALHLAFAALNAAAIAADVQTLRAHLDCGAPWWQIGVDSLILAMDAASLVAGTPPAGRLGLQAAQGTLALTRSGAGARSLAHLGWTAGNAARAGISYAAAQPGQLQPRRGGESGAAARGRAAHEEFRNKVRAKKGWQAQPRIYDPNTGTYREPDALTRSGRPIELKPNTPSGRRQGKRQLEIYEALTGKKGRVIYYDP